MRGSPRIEIGGVARAHGIRGEVVIVTHDPDTELETFETLWIDGALRKVTAARGTPKGWLVQIDGIATRNDAETLRGQAVEVDREQLELADEDLLLSDLIGCAVKTVGGEPWGTVHAIDAGDMQDLLVIHDGDFERLLPMVDEFVKDIDLDAGVVTVDPPDGLPELKRT
jgi:16S rRNA processing protein RimM